MVPHLMEKILIEALEKGDTVILNQLGGVSDLVDNKETIAISPFINDFISIVLREFNTFDVDDRELTESFILFCLEKITNEFAIQSTINCLEIHRPFSQKFEKNCFGKFLNEAQNYQKSAITRAWCLEAAFRLAIDNSSRRFQLLSYLVELPIEDNSEYLRHATKIVGLAYTFWGENDLISVLEKLTNIEWGADEAYFELGLVSLANALNAESTDEANTNFERAYSHFKKSLETSENRLDAEAFHAVLSILFSFQKNDLREDYNFNLERLKKAVLLYNAWNESDAGSIWTSARKTEMIYWQTLAIQLEALSGDLTEPSWFEPTIVIEQSLLNIYIASRTILKRNKSGGLEKLIQPNIEASLIHNIGQLHALDKWIERQPSEDLGSIGKTLREKINIFKEKTDLGKVTGAAVNSLILSVPQINVIRDLPNEKKSCLELLLQDQQELQKKDFSLILERILENCISEISQIEDYKNQRVSQTFNTLLLQTLRFLESRMNMTRKHYPRISYLFEPEKEEKLPLEKALQDDYFEFMYGNVYAGNPSVEKSDIASGRADIHFSFGSIQFIAEVKRDHQDCSFEALRKKYIGQALEYQNTSVKLGFLLVLDLMVKPHGTGTIEEHVKVEIITSENSQIKRAVVVVRVPGRRKIPSQVKLAP